MSSPSPPSFSSVFRVSLPPFASVAPFVVAIGGASVYVKTAEYRHYNQLEQQQHQSADEEGSICARITADKRRPTRRSATLATLLAVLLVGVAIIASLALIARTVHRMNEQHKMCGEAMKSQAERIELLENVVTKQMQMGEKEEEKKPDEKRRRMGGKSHDGGDQQQIVVQSATDDSGKGNGEERTQIQRNRPKHSVPAANRHSDGRDFVIFVKGRPMSGRQFVAHGGPNEK